MCTKDTKGCVFCFGMTVHHLWNNAYPILWVVVAMFHGKSVHRALGCVTLWRWMENVWSSCKQVIFSLSVWKVFYIPFCKINDGLRLLNCVILPLFSCAFVQCHTDCMLASWTWVCFACNIGKEHLQTHPAKSLKGMLFSVLRNVIHVSTVHSAKCFLGAYTLELLDTSVTPTINVERSS